MGANKRKTQRASMDRHLHIASYHAGRPWARMEMKLRAAIVGCGLIGEKRLRSFPQQCRLTACCDPEQDRAVRLAAAQNGARAYAHWEEIVTSSDVDVVFVATTHNMLAPVTYAAV